MSHRELNALIDDLVLHVFIKYWGFSLTEGIDASLTTIGLHEHLHLYHLPRTGDDSFSLSLLDVKQAVMRLVRRRRLVRSIWDKGDNASPPSDDTLWSLHKSLQERYERSSQNGGVDE
jgi:hypothetical protein